MAADFHGDCALSGDDVGVIVGRDKGQAFFLFEAETFGFGLVEIAAVEEDGGAETLDVAPFDGGGGDGHDDDGGDTECVAGEGDALGVVACVQYEYGVRRTGVCVGAYRQSR